MCGIYAKFSKGIESQYTSIRKDVSKLSHRGPDHFGEVINKESNYYLAHYRLSIIDLSSAADQPLRCARTGSELIYNGEIYNYRELASLLRSEGYPPSCDSSDTRILLDLLVVFGVEKCLQLIEGMFAFVYVDKRESRVFIARDHFGIKPIYYKIDSDSLTIASEAKAIAGYSDIREDSGLEFEYLYRRFISHGDTLFNGVRKLEPGHFASFSIQDFRSIKIQEYWRPLDRAANFHGKSSFKQTVEEVKILIEHAISSNLLSDVTPGLFLSSGIDSMSIAALARNSSVLTTVEPLQAISGYVQDSQECNETRLVQKTLNRLKIVNVPTTSIPFEHYSHDQQEQLAFLEDSPSVTTISSAIDCLYRQASKQGLKVVLSGEGADELFIGYQKWKSSLLIQKVLKKINARRIECFQAVLPNELALRHAETRPIFWGGSQGLSTKEIINFFDVPEHLVHELRENYFYKKVQPCLDKIVMAGLPTMSTHAMTYLDLKARLPELILNRADKVGMSHSIEGRFPYLNPRLAELIFSIPSSFHESFLSTKSLLRHSLNTALPSKVWWRRKWGLRLPQSKDSYKVDILTYIIENQHLFPWPLKHAAIKSLPTNTTLQVALLRFLYWKNGFKRYA
tara:strand:- start:145 stop:2019 length:1875 start_codon:yes stop_codon:yes gene_type:complete